MAPHAGFAAGIAKRSSIQRFAWALSGAPQRKQDLHLSPRGAVIEARKLRDSLTAKMHTQQLDPEAAAVFIAFATEDGSLADGSAMTLVSVEPDAEKEILIASRNGRNQAVGFVILIRDEEGIFGHSRPLLVDPISLALNEKALSAFLRTAASKFFPDRTN